MTREQFAKVRNQFGWENEAEPTAQGGEPPREARSETSEVSEEMEHTGTAQRKYGTPDGDSRAPKKIIIPESAKIVTLGLARCHPYQALAQRCLLPTRRENIFYRQ